MKRGSAGGKATAIAERNRAIDKYYTNPNYCLFCGNIIPISDGTKVSQIRLKKYCNHSCAAKYYNRYNHSPVTRNYRCKKCGCDISIYNSAKRKYCDQCKGIAGAESSSASGFHIADRSKGDVFNGYDNWQSARSAINRHAGRVLELSGDKKACRICGYDVFVDVCHIKPVASFGYASLIREINSLSNLIYLCPNHHREFDKKIIDITEI